jgi:hypothetical protein
MYVGKFLLFACGVGLLLVVPAAADSPERTKPSDKGHGILGVSGFGDDPPFGGGMKPPTPTTPGTGGQPPDPTTPTPGGKPPPKPTTPANGTKQPPKGTKPTTGTKAPPKPTAPTPGTKTPPKPTTPTPGTKQPPKPTTPAPGTKLPPKSNNPNYNLDVADPVTPKGNTPPKFLLNKAVTKAPKGKTTGGTTVKPKNDISEVTTFSVFIRTTSWQTWKNRYKDGVYPDRARCDADKKVLEGKYPDLRMRVQSAARGYELQFRAPGWVRIANGLTKVAAEKRMEQLEERYPGLETLSPGLFRYGNGGASGGSGGAGGGDDP